MKTRHDAWTHENDVLLAQTVLRHIENHSTQTAAFEEVGNLLNRTSAACGFRWNAEVRQHYIEEFEEAKKRRKKKAHQAKKANNIDTQVVNSANDKDPNEIQKKPIQSITIQDCIAFLTEYDQQSYDKSKEENIQLQKEHEELLKTNQELSLKYRKLEKQKEKLNQEYKVLIGLIGQAQNLSDDSFKQKQYYH